MDNLIILGLSDMNIHRLIDEHPIMFNLKELELRDVDVVIAYAPPYIVTPKILVPKNYKRRETIVFGLTNKDIAYVECGKSITYKMDEFGLVGKSFFVFNGRTEESMYIEMLDLIDLEKTKMK